MNGTLRKYPVNCLAFIISTIHRLCIPAKLVLSPVSEIPRPLPRKFAFAIRRAASTTVPLDTTHTTLPVMLIARRGEQVTGFGIISRKAIKCPRKQTGISVGRWIFGWTRRAPDSRAILFTRQDGIVPKVHRQVAYTVSGSTDSTGQTYIGRRADAEWSGEQYGRDAGGFFSLFFCKAFELYRKPHAVLWHVWRNAGLCEACNRSEVPCAGRRESLVSARPVRNCVRAVEFSASFFFALDFCFRRLVRGY